MTTSLVSTLKTSIVKKQIIALTGLFQGFFILGHLSGNFLIFRGPEAFNDYAHFLAGLGAAIWAARIGLICCFAVHVFIGITLYLENRTARGKGYAVSSSLGETNLAKKTMIVSGLLVFFFLILHLMDFTFGAKTGPATVVAGGESLGLYGLVWNSFLFSEHWWRPSIYLLVVCLLGLHLGHGFQSIFQTYGFNHERYTPIIERLSALAGVVIALGFSSIPIYTNIVRVPPL